jgi:hypothetical protein
MVGSLNNQGNRMNSEVTPFTIVEPKGVKKIVIDENLLGQYLPQRENRYKHILGVVERMKECLNQIHIDESLKPQLIQAAYLHDIGYSTKLNVHHFHPLDGAIFAQSAGFSKPVIAAVLFHSGAYESVKATRPDLDSIYTHNNQLLDEQDQLFIRLVTYCDLHTSPTGEKISFEERIRDIVNRYGEEHEVSQFMLGNRTNFLETICWVEQLKTK